MQWLFTVCRNLSFKLKTKEKRYTILLEDDNEMLDEAKNPAESLDFLEQKTHLLKCIEKLSPLQNKVIKCNEYYFFWFPTSSNWNTIRSCINIWF